MVVCDICGIPGTGTLVSAEDMRKAVFKNGFNPFALGLAGQFHSAFGIDSSAAFEGWKRTIVAQDTSDWNICPRCMSKLKSYLEGPPRPTGVKKATVSASPIVGALAAAEAERKYKQKALKMVTGETPPTKPVTPPLERPRPEGVRAPPIPIPRAPLTGVKILAVLEALAAAPFLAAGFYLAGSYPGSGQAILTVSLGLLLVISVALLLSAVGLWKGKRWARILSMIFAAIGIVMGLTAAIVNIVGGLLIIIPSAAIIYYLTRPHVKDFF